MNNNTRSSDWSSSPVTTMASTTTDHGIPINNYIYDGIAGFGGSFDANYDNFIPDKYQGYHKFHFESPVLFMLQPH